MFSRYNLASDIGQMIAAAEAPVHSAENFRYLIVTYSTPYYDGNGDYQTWGTAYRFFADAEEAAAKLAREYTDTKFYVAAVKMSVKAELAPVVTEFV